MPSKARAARNCVAVIIASTAPSGTQSVTSDISNRHCDMSSITAGPLRAPGRWSTALSPRCLRPRWSWPYSTEVGCQSHSSEQLEIGGRRIGGACQPREVASRCERDAAKQRPRRLHASRRRLRHQPRSIGFRPTRFLSSAVQVHSWSMRAAPRMPFMA